MARPKKAVVDYFPHYVNHGKTMFTIESKFGNDGYSFWFKLLEILGSTEQHFIDCNNPETWEYLLAKTRMSEENAIEILDLLSKLNAIDKDLWQNKLIWSENFISNLLTVYTRREVLLYNKEDLRGLCLQKLPIIGVSDNINPQSKVKYSKQEESKQDNSLSENPTDSEQNKHKSEFEIFRKAFTGTKLGLETEFKTFIKKNKDYRKIIPLLLPAIEKENAHRQKAIEIGAFFPASKSLSSWLSKRYWEQELQDLVPKNDYHKEETKQEPEYKKKVQSYNGLL